VFGGVFGQTCAEGATDHSKDERKDTLKLPHDPIANGSKVKREHLVKHKRRTYTRGHA
jgi:hypothetical protein